MADRTGIEWCDATWNPIRGCSRVSEGCRHCYAERVAARFWGPGQPYEGLVRRVGGETRWSGQIKVVDTALDQPLRWRKPRRIFVNSMSDLFHEGLDDAAITRIFAVMALCPQHTFMVLTKRPERMAQWLDADGQQRRDDVYSRACSIGALWSRRPGPAWPLPNVWLGVSIEDQATADARIPLLLQTPAAVRFISAEPLLGPVDVARWLSEKDRCECERGDYGTGRTCGSCPEVGRVYADGAYDEGKPETCWTKMVRLDWVIVGGESGPRARPMHPDWARSLRDQCKAASVAFFFKQWGSCWPEPNAWMAPGWRLQVERYGSPKKLEATIEGVRYHEWPTP